MECNLIGFGGDNININQSGGGGDPSSINNNNIPHHHTLIYNNSVIFDHHHHSNNGGGASASVAMMQLDDEDNNNSRNNINDEAAGSLGFISPSSSSSVKAKIMSHPHYPRLLSAYLNCQKIGAPPEVVERLEAACRASVMAAVSAGSSGGGGGGTSSSTTTVGQDPGLDQFMEAYCEMLIKYEQELSKPFKEAMLFLSRIDSQFKAISFSPSASGCGEGGMDRNGSSEEDADVDINVDHRHHNVNNNNQQLVDPQAEERELKGQLLRKYSGYLGSLKQEFMKKRKKGKLPKEARQQLLDWWTRHYKWPYPSEAQKLDLAESTGLDQKQINNWFINQRKRHWKPSEDMQFVVMADAAAAAHHPHYYIHHHDMNIFGNPNYPMDVSLL